MSFSWSKWNFEVNDSEKMLLQGAEHLKDEPLLEVNYDICEYIHSSLDADYIQGRRRHMSWEGHAPTTFFFKFECYYYIFKRINPLLEFDFYNALTPHLQNSWHRP